jgi:hypothetical protein
VEIKQEIKREGTGDAGAKEFRIEGREGSDTDSKSQGVSQPDQGMNVADTSPVHSDLTGHIKMYNQGEPTCHGGLARILESRLLRIAGTSE